MSDTLEEQAAEEPGGIYGTVGKLAQTTNHPADRLTLGALMDTSPVKTQADATATPGTEVGRSGIQSYRARLTNAGQETLGDPAFADTELSNTHSDFQRMVEEERVRAEGLTRRL